VPQTCWREVASTTLGFQYIIRDHSPPTCITGDLFFCVFCGVKKENRTSRGQNWKLSPSLPRLDDYSGRVSWKVCASRQAAFAEPAKSTHPSRFRACGTVFRCSIFLRRTTEKSLGPKTLARDEEVSVSHRTLNGS
jgi:hypothetical protein